MRAAPAGRRGADPCGHNSWPVGRCCHPRYLHTRGHAIRKPPSSSGFIRPGAFRPPASPATRPLCRAENRRVSQVARGAPAVPHTCLSHVVCRNSRLFSELAAVPLAVRFRLGAHSPPRKIWCPITITIFPSLVGEFGVRRIERDSFLLFPQRRGKVAREETKFGPSGL